MELSAAHIIFPLVLAVAVALWAYLPRLVASGAGKWLLFTTLAALPFLLMNVGITQSVVASKQKSFCVSCHEMQVYETSLHIDDPEYMPALHYQNRYVHPDTACYTCHTDYSLYGDVQAKLAGLNHAWVHFSGKVPPVGDIKLYRPYPNDNCLQCHKGARRFERRADHNRDGVTLELLYSNQKSCLSGGCHDKAHHIRGLAQVDLWGDPAFPVPDALKNLAPQNGADDPFADDPFADDPDEGSKDNDDSPQGAKPKPASMIENVDDLWGDDDDSAEPAKPDMPTPPTAAGEAGGAPPSSPSALPNPAVPSTPNSEDNEP